MLGRPLLHRFVVLTTLTLGLSSWFSHTNAFVTPHRNRLEKLQTQRYNVATDFLTKEDEDEPTNTNVVAEPEQVQEKLSRPERKALERQKKQQQQKVIKKQKPKYNLHSTAVSILTKDSTADDVMRAIKRAQNLHDHHDLRVVADFLINECDVGFAYGYRGSLLARLAVAALHFENHEVARRAIDIRRVEYRLSMMPMESAAIVRGLLRVHNATDALELLHDELSLPLEVRKQKRFYSSVRMMFFISHSVDVHNHPFC
jgi:hypothetical protein